MWKKEEKKIICLNGQLEVSLIMFVLPDLSKRSLNFMGVETSCQSLLAQDLGHNPSSKPAVIKQKLFPCLLKIDMFSYPRSMNIIIIMANYSFLLLTSKGILKIVSKVHSSLLQAFLFLT